MFQDVPELFFPILWFEQQVIIPDEYVWVVLFVKSLPTILATVAYVSIFVGFAILALVLCSTSVVVPNASKMAANKIYGRENVPLSGKDEVRLLGRIMAEET